MNLKMEERRKRETNEDMNKFVEREKWTKVAYLKKE